MPLVAIRVAVLRGEIGQGRVAEREGIAFVVIIRFVLRIGVIGLPLQVICGTLGDAERDAVVETARARLHGDQACIDSGRTAADSVCTSRSQSRSPWAAEDRIVAVDEAR